MDSTKGFVKTIIKGLKRYRIRMVLGAVFLAAELFLFFGTGVLREEERNFLTGEGAWWMELSPQNNTVVQEFSPQYARLELFSISMDMSRSVHGSGTVRVSLTDEAGGTVFERAVPFYEMTDHAFTDFPAGLVLDPSETYRLSVYAETEYEDEYPAVSVCKTEQYMPENRRVTAGDDKTGDMAGQEGIQLVTRYVYKDAVTAKRMRNACVLSLVTALGVAFGIPKNKKVKRAAAVLFFLATPCVLGRRLELLTYNPYFYIPFAMQWNIGIMYALEFIVLLFTHSFAFAALFTNFGITALYSANYFMRIYRGTSLRMNDIVAAGTAKEVVGGYDLTPNSHLAFAWAMYLFVFVWCVQTFCVPRLWKLLREYAAARKQDEAAERSARKTLLGRLGVTAATYLLTVCLALGGLFYGGHQLLYTDFLAQRGFADKGMLGFGYELIYSINGYLVATCIEVKNSHILPPAGYSPEAAEEILKNAAQEDEEADTPHVILIMNESLSDLNVLDTGMEMSGDSLAFIHSLGKNTVKGYANASVFGGGTANSEFEVLTGCSMAFFSVNYYPYYQAVKKPLGTMVSQMKRQGYTTVSIHPERPGNWERERIYNEFGFDRMFWKDDFKNAEYIHSGASDAATYRKIIDLYENRADGEKLFVFDLTMQNHGGYDLDGPPYEVTAVNLNEPKVNEFLSLMKISDKAFEDLVRYFEGQDEKVLICMFGDHQPWVSDLVVSSDLTDGNDASERIMKKYKTPFVIWTNYETESADGVDISMNYLGGLVMRRAGLNMSPYFCYLEKLREEYPILTINGYVDAEGNYASWSGLDDEFAEYRILQYNYLFDSDSAEWGYR